MAQRIEPAHVVLDAGGVPFNETYGDVYASRDGALAQARQVFLAGNDLPARWQDRDQFVIVETGFGLGVNFLATWQAWRADPRRPRCLHFVSIERHPVDAATLLRLAPPDLEPLARELAAAWPLPLAGLQRRAFEEGRIALTLAFGDVTDLVAQVVAGADAFFLDGFAPARNPQMWTPAVLKSLARMARADATLATWCTARAVQDGLVAGGFVVELAPGFGKKRQMLRARFAPRWRVRRHEPPAAPRGERRAIVIGAGLAGAFAARALAERDWRVQVLDRGERVAADASSLPWGLLHPQVTADDNPAARLTRCGYFLARAWLERLAPAGDWHGSALWRSDGMLLQADDAEESGRWQALARTLALPPEFARFQDIASATALLGVAPRSGGWWFAGGTRVAAARLCAALLDHARISVHLGQSIDRLRNEHGEWIAADRAGAPIAMAPACVVAAALDAPRLLGIEHARVRAERGRMTLLHAPALASLRASVSGGGTLVRIEDDCFAIGATYEGENTVGHAVADEGAAHESNLQRLARLLAAVPAARPTGIFDAIRCVARDRLPLAGNAPDEQAAQAHGSVPAGPHLIDLPRRPGLHASFAFGSRGLALAPLAAEWIAAQIEGEPWPLERDLAARIDAGRFLLEALRAR